MPLHQLPTRRSFLLSSAAALPALAILRDSWADDDLKQFERFALLSDTHIPNEPGFMARGTDMTANLQQVVRELIGLAAKPTGVMINGDCAYLKGLPEDYRNLAQCVAPLLGAGLPLHLTMGNHDDREPLFAALQQQKPAAPMLASKHVSVIESRYANWFLLDSLTKVNVVTGELGAEQRSWLAKALAARPDKPALLLVHHNPQFDPPPEGTPWGGIKDTSELMELVGEFRQVKALIFGHTHNWSITQRGILHLINLPPVAYVFAPGRPNGWVLAEVHERGMNLNLRAIDPRHQQHGQRVELVWDQPTAKGSRS